MESKIEYTVTETPIDPKLADAVVGMVRQMKITGKLTFDISQGSIQRVLLVERTRPEAV